MPPALVPLSQYQTVVAEHVCTEMPIGACPAGLVNMQKPVAFSFSWKALLPFVVPPDTM
jgi:hypothetical protein